MIEKNILSQIIVGLVVTVIGAVIIDKIKPNPSDESPQNESLSRNVNRPSNSGDNQSDRQNLRNSTSPNHENYYPEPKSVDENYSSYINPKTKADVSVIIVDADGNLSNTSSSSIAEVYQNLAKARQ